MLTPYGNAGIGGMSDPRNPVMDTVGWATATVLTTGATAPLLGSPDELLGVPASTVVAAGSSVLKPK